jgi:exopolyphosphatase/guanosine-5'-triphosphate,3'-diphosphate pyrophosphatase
VLDSCREIDPKTNVITADGIEAIVEALCEAGHVDAMPFAAVTPDRRNVFAGGVVILKAVFAQLKIAQMRWSDGAMREGLLYDMIGRAEHRDPRAASIAALSQRYAVDQGQAERVQATALALFDKVAREWQLGHVERDWLLWGARIHEIGLAIAHSQHHLHGAYIAENSDLAGFARHEQQVLAALVRSHRRKPDDAVIKALPERLRRPIARITALLRMAVLLQRGRAADPAPPIELQADDKQLQIRLPQSWLANHPLTRADLEQERDYLKQLDIKLQIRSDDSLVAA